MTRKESSVPVDERKNRFRILLAKQAEGYAAIAQFYVGNFVLEVFHAGRIYSNSKENQYTDERSLREPKTARLNEPSKARVSEIPEVSIP